MPVTRRRNVCVTVEVFTTCCVWPQLNNTVDFLDYAGVNASKPESHLEFLRSSTCDSSRMNRYKHR